MSEVEYAEEAEAWARENLPPTEARRVIADLRAERDPVSGETISRQHQEPEVTDSREQVRGRRFGGRYRTASLQAWVERFEWNFDDALATLQDLMPTVMKAEPDTEEAVVVRDVVMRDLAAEDRRLLEERYYSNDSMEEMAQARGVTRQAISKRLRSTLRRLAEALQNRGIDG